MANATNVEVSIMSLKDEIEKLINAERSKLEERDKKDAEYNQRQRQRFASLRVILQEISASVDPKYLESRVDDYSAKIELGRIEKSTRSTETRWEIEPNYTYNFARHHSEAAESFYSEEPGFKVEETEYSHCPEFDTSEDTKTFQDEQAVSEYLIKKITEKVAHYMYLESLVAKRKEAG